MERSRKLALTNWTQANDALNQYFAGNKFALANRLGMSHETVTAFFQQRPIPEADFCKICVPLQLKWQSVSEVQSSAPQSQQETAEKPTILPSDNDFEAIVQRVRERCRKKILSQHSQMRLLSSEKIGVDQLYVDLWLLNRPPHKLWVSPSMLLKTFDFRTDRLGLGDRIQRNPGFEVANENPKLVILGKPGSGKTTFLKHLALDWCKGQFQPDLIAVLIEFRQIRDEQWLLLDVLGKMVGSDDGHQIETLKREISELEKEIETLKRKISELERQIRELEKHVKVSQEKSKSQEEVQHKKKQKEEARQKLEESRQKLEESRQKLNVLPLQMLLIEGKLFVLMDGLDEVPTNSLRIEVQRQLSSIAEEYPKNRFILTCRTQVITHTPSGFTEVEAADFNPEQVQQFVQNWFVANNKSDVEVVQRWETLSNSARSNPALKELMVTPVLLSLICLVLDDEGEIPSQITWLYEKGIRLLLCRWNDNKEIDDWEVGGEIYRQLSIPRKQKLLANIAARKFENPKNFVLFEEEEIAVEIAQFLGLANPRQGIIVLKAIEAQHGLLIERADELWSFSHLTFQEYFTFQWLIQLSIGQLTKIISNSQWREVVKQLVKSQQPADRLLRLIKQAIDQLLANDEIVNKFLAWVFQEAKSIQIRYKPAAIRAFYFARARARARVRARDLGHALARARDFDSNLARDFALTLDLALARARDLTRDLTYALDLVRALDPDPTLDTTLDPTLDPTLDHAYMAKLVDELEGLRRRIPKDSVMVSQWWKTQPARWTTHLRQGISEHRHIDDDWQFTDGQKQRLQRYYDANKFLVDLMNIEGAVSDDVRAEIEDTLLLPWDELQRRQPEIYSSSSSVVSSSINVFISYSPEDQDLQEKLDQHLANLKRQGKIQAWHRGVIEAGAEWDVAIKNQLETAQIILLLISANFIASDYCYDQQLQRALQRHDAGTARVIPVILRPTDWQNSAFSHLSPLPSNGQAITSWANRDEAFVNVVAGIRDAIERGFS